MSERVCVVFNLYTHFSPEEGIGNNDYNNNNNDQNNSNSNNSNNNFISTALFHVRHAQQYKCKNIKTQMQNEHFGTKHIYL